MSDNFNNNLRNAFEQAEDDFNPEIIWQGINDKMPPAKKDKKRFLILLILGLGLGVFFFGLYIRSNTFESDLATDDKLLKNEKNISNREFIQDLPVTNNELVSNEKTQDLNLTYSTTNNTDHKESTSYVNIKKEIETESTDSTNEIIETDVISASFPIQITEAILNQSTVTPPSIEDPDELDTERMLNLLDHHKNYSTLELELREVLSIPFHINQSPILEIKEPTVKNNFIKGIEVYSEIAIGSKVNTSANSEYIINRNNAEELLEQLSFGARANFFEFNKFSIWLGVKYALITDSWNAQYEYNEDLPYTYLEYTIESVEGDIEDHFTTDIVAYDVNRRVVQYNQEQIISIPLELRYTAQLSRWSVSPTVGLELNYLLGANHTSMGIDGLPVNENKTGLWIAPSILGGINTSYSFSSDWKITAGLNYSVLTINNSTLIPDLNSTYTLYGFELGVGRRF